VSAAEPPVVVVHPRPGQRASQLDDITATALRHPGEHRLTLRFTSLSLTLGPAYGVDASRELVAELAHFGRVELLGIDPGGAAGRPAAGVHDPSRDRR
jgi:hypothetical protein